MTEGQRFGKKTVEIAVQTLACGTFQVGSQYFMMCTLQSVMMCTLQSVMINMCLCQEEICKTNKTIKEGEYLYWRPFCRVLGAKEAFKRKRKGQLMIRMDEEGTPTYRITTMKESETVKPNPWIPP
jgi:hypothetical protein